MMWNIILLLIAALSISVSAKSSIYLDVAERGFSYCFRRLNATDSIGCSSKRSGNVGSVVMMIDDEIGNFYDYLSPENAPYVIVMSVKHFANQTFMSQLNDHSLVTGVVVVQPQSEKQRPKSFSEDYKCPNAKHSMYSPKKQCSGTTWNRPGRDYFFRKWNFPIVLLHRSERQVLEKIIECNNMHNGKNSTDDRRCAIEIKTPMNAVKNSRVCLRRNFYNSYLIRLAGFCDVMYGYNFHTVARPVVSPSKGIILVIARMGALSMFVDHGFGSYAVSSSVGIIISLAEAFSKLDFKSTDTKKQIIFSLVDGEPMGYVGSTKMVYNIVQKKFLTSVYEKPVNFSNIETIIELDQLGKAAVSGKFYAHVVANGNQKKADDEWIRKLQRYKESISIEKKEDDVLPPSSTQSFLKQSDDISTVLLSDYMTHYINEFYNSMFDDEPKIEFDKLYDLANSLYKSLLNVAYDTTKDLKLDRTSFDEVVGCFFNISGCGVKEVLEPFKRNFDIQNMTVLDMSLRMGGSHFQVLVRNMEYIRSGEIVTDVKKKGDCKAKDEKYPRYDYRWITTTVNGSSAGICMRNILVLEKTSVVTDEDAWSEWNTTVFSYWTESIWIKPTVRIFLKPSKSWETIVLSTGVIVTLLSILCLVLVLKRFDDLFPGTSYMPGTISP